VSPWSSTSTSDSAASCQSSIEIKEFYYDDDVMDVADWTTLTLTGNGHMTRDYVTARHARPDSSQDAVVNTGSDTAAGSGAGFTGSADKTLTAGRCFHLFRN